MSSSTSLLTQITSTQSGKEVTVNSLVDALSPASIFGRNALTTNLLQWGWFGGEILLDGVLTAIANGTLAMFNSATNYIEATRAGVVSTNTTAFTAGRIPLYSVVCNVTTATSYTDYRMTSTAHTGRLALAMTDANTTLSQAQAANNILEFTGTLTIQRNIVVPLAEKNYIVYNGTTGGFGLQFIPPSGTGIVVAAGKRAIVYANGVNVVRATSDV